VGAPAHLSSPPLAFTAVLHLEPGQSTWLQAVIDRWAPWPGFAVAFRPRVRGRYELVARHRRHTTQFADDASVCGSVFDVG
jgi:hypothetical protein